MCCAQGGGGLLSLCWSVVQRPWSIAPPGLSSQAGLGMPASASTSASSWGPARADGIPAAARGMGTRRRVTARCLFGSSAALPGSMWESSSQQHLPGREYGLRFAANSPLLSSSQRDVRLDFYPPLLCPLRCPDLKQSGHISFKELRDGTLGSS